MEKIDVRLICQAENASQMQAKHKMQAIEKSERFGINRVSGSGFKKPPQQWVGTMDRSVAWRFV